MARSADIKVVSTNRKAYHDYAIDQEYEAGIALMGERLSSFVSLSEVLFAALIGMWFLKEVFTPRRIVGTCVIVVGVMALRLG